MNAETAIARLLFSTLAVLVLSPPAAPAAEKKPEKWVEIESPHFVVASNAGEKQVRQVAEHFEQFRGVFQSVLPKLRVDPGQPIVILAAKDEKSLKELLPEYWETKGRFHPTGVFIGGSEKNYIALRVDAEGENPYQIVHHEYVHVLVRLNFDRVPLWLNEGLAEFYANTVIAGKEVELGRPDASHLNLLKQEKLLSLDVFLTADHSSPYYNEANKASIFYAQAWALTHYFLLGDKGAHREQLVDFLDLLRQEVNDREAAQRVFGPTKELQRKLEEYVRQASFYYVPLNAPIEIGARAFPARSLSSAEAAAVRGDFQVHMRRPVEARALLEEAMRLDPTLAAPRESMGLLYYREGKIEEASKWFAEAVALDSKSFLAHYFHAWLSAQGTLTLERVALAEKELRRAIELNPNYAPAYASLAQLHAARREKLDEALALATHATQLEPAALTHHLAVATVLLQMERVEEARQLGQQLLDAAKTPADRAAATSFLEIVRSFQAEQAEKAHGAAEAKQAGEKRREERPARPARGETAASPGTEPPASSGKVGTGASASLGPLAMGEGRVTWLICDGTALDLTLEYYSYTLKLHSENYFKIEYLTTRWQPPKNFDPCAHLKGRDVEVQYRLAVNRPYAGEIVSVEVRK